jgi:demethylmenaquinone methyltransferase/2-methoxy-6-polyprenyl-1,4-benzoquinol methylase
MTNAGIYIQRSLEANPLREPVLRAAIQSLGLPLGSNGLDAGSGIGLQALLLAEAVGPDGHITGIDIVLELLAFGNDHVRRAGFSDRITFCQGDVSRIPFADDSFDWVWSADCIGYPLGEWAPLLEELVRIVRPGGSVIILGWSSQQLLPGYPLLEARLNATCSGYIPFLEGKNPELNFLRAIRWFREAGLEEVKAQTFVGDVQAPLGSGERAALMSLFEMLWGQPQPKVSPQDWNDYERLCEPGSADFILDIPDYYAFFTYSLFRGKVPLVRSPRTSG